MPNLDAFLKFVEDDPLELPIGGKTYVVKSPSIEDGEFLQRLTALGTRAAMAQQADLEISQAMRREHRVVRTPDESKRLQDLALTDRELAALQLDDDEERSLFDRVLGVDVVRRMRADGVSYRQLQAANQYALMFFTLGEDAADKAVAQAVDAGKARTNSTSTGAASSTRQRASGTTTRSRKTAAKR